jgi:hypothetical protein
MPGRSRKLIGMIVLLAGLTAYVALVATIATTWLPGHWAVQVAFFAVAGVAWALPLKPFMAWMNSGAEDGADE